METHEICCKISTTSYPCPVCGKLGRKVTSKTLDNHIPSHLRSRFGNEAAFCSNPACDVVYCDSHGQVIRKGETVLPVTVKDPGDDVYVCYCFQFTRGNIRRDLERQGKTDIPEQIKKGVQEGRCDCERKNPQGACCLGNVVNAVKAIEEELKN